MVNSLLAGLDGWIFDVLYFIPKLIYFLCSMCTMVLDLLQLMFRKFAGLDTYYINGNEMAGPVVDSSSGQSLGSGDIILQIINQSFFDTKNSVIAVAFWSIIILSAIMLVVTTIVAIIRNEYTPDKDKKNSKTGIVINFFKAIFSFVIIPLSCYFGIWLGNIVLFAVDTAISPTATAFTLIQEVEDKIVIDEDTGSPANYCFMGVSVPAKFTPLSGYISNVCLFQGNRVRSESNFYDSVIKLDDVGDTTTNFGIFDSDKLKTLEEVAGTIDGMFMINAKVQTPQKLNTSANEDPGWIFVETGQIEIFDKANVGLVSYYYNLWYFNFPVAIAFILVMGKLLIELCFGLMTRIITLLALLLVGPITMSFMPIDGGGALSRWSSTFIKKVISSYVVVLAMNIFYLVLPILDTITFFDYNAGLFWVNYFIRALFVITGLMSVKTIISLFNSLFGSEDLAKEGASASGGTFGMVKNVVGKTAATGKLALGAAGLGVGLATAVAGTALGGAGKAINFAQRRRESHRLSDAVTRGNESDAQLKQRSLSEQKNAVSEQATQDYNAELDRRSQDAYNKGFAGKHKITYDEYKNATGENSYYAAEQRYNALSNEEKKAAGYKAKFMKDEWAKSADSETMTFNRWQNIGKVTKKNESLTYDNVKSGMRSYQADRELEINRGISNALQSGVATNDIERQAIKDYQKSLQDRSDARGEAVQHARKLDDLNRKNENRKWRLAHLGAGTFKKSAGGALSSINSIVGKSK